MADPVLDPALEPARVSAYLQRLGVAAPVAVDLDGLRALHVAHLRRIPFENLDIHLGVPIVLDVGRIVDKLTARRRGGFCYELNGGFAALLRALGFRVSLHEARVYDGDEVGIRFDHLCLRVDLDEPFLVDVGFGAAFDEPLRLVTAVEQRDPAGLFEIGEQRSPWFDLLQDGARQYRFDLTPRQLRDFAPGCAHHQTSPESHFTHNPVCSMRTEAGRVTIRRRTLIETAGGDRSERELTVEQLREAYRAHFGIELGDDAVRALAADEA